MDRTAGERPAITAAPRRGRWARDRSPAGPVVRRVISAIARVVPVPRARVLVPRVLVRVISAIVRVVPVPTAPVRVAMTGRAARPSPRPVPRLPPPSLLRPSLR
jgi:hypothetical protein